MSTTIDINVSGQELLDRDNADRQAKRLAWLENQEDLQVEEEALIYIDEEEDPTVVKASDEPAAVRKSRGMFLLPKFPPVAPPQDPLRSFYLFDGPLRRAVNSSAVPGRTFVLNCDPADADSDGSYVETRRIEKVGPNGRPVLEVELKAFPYAITGAVGFVSTPPEGAIIVNLLDQEQVGNFNPGDYDGKTTVYVGVKGVGYARVNPTDKPDGAGNYFTLPFLVRTYDNHNTTSSFPVEYVAGEADPNGVPTRAYMGNGLKTASFFVKRVSGTPFEVIVSLGVFRFVLSHSHWAGSISKGSRLECTSFGEPVVLPAYTDDMDEWTHVGLSVSSKSFRVFIDRNQVFSDELPEISDWDETKFFPDYIEINQAMWPDVDFGDYKTKIHLSSFRFGPGRLRT